MQLPTIQGTFPQQDFFIYTAADSGYFDIHARPLIESIRKNTLYSVHIHIYNPTDEQLRFCKSRTNVSYTYEYINFDQNDQIKEHWLKKSSFSNGKEIQMQNKIKSCNTDQINSLIKQTYYACVRFIRLQEIKKESQQCLAIDVDGIVRNKFPYQTFGKEDVFLYRKPKTGAYLAGAIFLQNTPGSNRFLIEYAQSLKDNFLENNIYWFLDQKVLDSIVTQFNVGSLSIGYIDWSMKGGSYIWSAKGKKKEIDIFKKEQQKYS
jgi:hypothetical protein